MKHIESEELNKIVLDNDLGYNVLTALSHNHPFTVNITNESGHYLFQVKCSSYELMEKVDKGITSEMIEPKLARMIGTILSHVITKNID